MNSNSSSYTEGLSVILSYVINQIALRLTMQSLNVIYPLQEMADTSSARGSLFCFNLKDYFLRSY